jgi:hypothetical protein
MKRIYNQSQASVYVDGVRVQGFAEGGCIIITPIGGEVEMTQGLDGGAPNQATNQGGTIKLCLRENSTSHSYFSNMRKAQEQGMASDDGFMVTVRSGIGVLHRLVGSLISRPGELTTGDKKMGVREWTFASPDLEEDNLDIASAALVAAAVAGI